ncbi:MAG: cysteine--tRNA ligase [bacterium]
MKLYNTLTRKKENFQSIKPKQAGLYTCGPTVYNYAHIGNLRSFIFEDIVKRALTAEGYKVRHIMNITDIDDKTIEASVKHRETLGKFTSRYTDFFKADIKKLNIIPPKKFALATSYIKKMVSAVKVLIAKGLAYEKDGSVYFKISAFKNYGRLSGLDKRELKIGATVNTEDYSKENPADFVLWKAWQKKDGAVFWNSPWGKGRPGWHLECAVIANDELGSPLDIHAGGVDLIFPHHENEIAEAEGLTGKTFSRFWLHGEHLLVDDKKMSKSLKNFYTLRDLQAKNFAPLSYRYFVLQAHYRSKLNFTWEALRAADNALKKIYTEARELYFSPPARGGVRGGGSVELEQKFSDAIADDLNTPEALAVLWELLKSDYPPSAKAETLLKFDKILGLGIKKYLGKKIKAPREVLELVKQREVARVAKDWKQADKLRAEIESQGFEVEDTPSGAKLLEK